MDGHHFRSPTRRPVEDFDLAAAVSLARQFLAERDHASNVTDRRACDVVRQLLRHHEAIAERAQRPKVAYDRQLVADILRNPQKYRSDVVLMQAALVAGDVGPDSQMSDAPLAGRRRSLHEDNGA